MKSAYSFIHEALREKRNTPQWRDLLAKWRRGRAITQVEKPFNIARARRLGYKAKKGIIVVRVRVRRGQHKRPRPRKGRKSSKLSIRKNLRMNYQWIAEQRAARKFKNLEVLNSYKLGKDGKYYFFEVILVDPNAPEIKTDKQLSWICSKKHRGRAFRGLTSAAKKSRGLK
ncbi:MAG: 50S ribosomal protein L15e [Candidatus Pacearchaeota archaeon]|nr:50S ribosomal protein L15e [Candidatus Pacearchaeota archaeon]